MFGFYVEGSYRRTGGFALNVFASPCSVVENTGSVFPHEGGGVTAA